MKIYLAGPEVFLPDAVQIGQAKKRLCAAYGFEGLYPFDNEIVASPAGERTDRLIYRANESLIRRADIGICNLTPFRGLSADPGTVFEVGMLAGLGKPVLGYTNVVDDLLDRFRRQEALSFDAANDAWHDAHGMVVENFGNADNLMIDCALVETGGHPMVRHKADPREVFRDLTGFEECLRRTRGRAAKPA